MNTNDILGYLKEHPEFLIQHAAELNIRVSESKVRSFAEAQIAAADKKIDNMARNMEQISQNAEANKRTMERIFQLNLSLLACNTVSQVLKAVSGRLNNDFNLPNFCLLLTTNSRKKQTIPPEMHLTDTALAERLASLSKPKCANKLVDEKLIKRLPDPDAESFLHLPLRYNNNTIGVLVIGHKDPAYFAPDTPTEYVSLMAEAIATALAKMMGLNK
ncbi:MAG: DUF484 family protein [Neisseriaceae bacterium]|nr:DUF484 family protein [Neisseriaceae bacterium]